MAIVVKEGFVALRLGLVLWALSPVFFVWAIRGSEVLDQMWLSGLAATTILAPAMIFWWRLRQVKSSSTGGSVEELTVRRLTDRREHLLSYLFPLVMSSWEFDFKSPRELAACLFVMLFTGIAFWHLQLTYVNLWFAIAGFRSVQVERNSASNHPLRPVILLTRCTRLSENDTVEAYRLTNSLYLHKPAR
jgi:hypothetical protein